MDRTPTFTAHLALAFFAGMAPAAFGQDSAPAPGMIEADAAFAQAVAKGDGAALEKLLDADFTWIGADGKRETRAQVLRAVPKPAVANANGAESKAYTYGDLGNVQVHSGRSHILRVWAKRPAGWRAVVYQEVMSRETPPTFTPGAGKECENPCKSIPFTPNNETERQVAAAYSKLETAAHAHNAEGFAIMVGDEFAALSSNSDKLQTKSSRIEEFKRSKDAGLAPTPLVSARMLAFGDAVLMLSEHKPDRGNPLRVTRIWVKRAGNWVETLSYQTALGAAQ
jgi:hypothetical protein